MQYVIDGVKRKMPWLKDIGITIQHDGAPGHNGVGNVATLDAAGLEGGWNIKFHTQPSQSPDLNINDLGFFASIKARVSHIKNKARTIPELLANFKIAYDGYDGRTLDKIWAHQIDCWNEILKVDGSNQYKPPHKGAARGPRNAPSAVDLTVSMPDFNRNYNAIYE